jgi:DinB superfamily
MGISGTRYTTLSPAALADEFLAISGDAASIFGRYDDRQLNWQPHAAGWSIAQCFDHLLKADHEMFQAIGRALDRRVTPTIWQRLPLWPHLFGWMLVTSQGPGGTRKYTAPAIARPATSDIAPGIIDRFIACQQTGIAGVRDLSAEDARRIMVSPFVSRITYSVLDGYRLVAAHQRRHFEQARRVTEHPEFPRVPRSR